MSSNVNKKINNKTVDASKNSFLEKIHNRADIISERSDDVYSSFKTMGYDTYNPENSRRWNKTFSRASRSSERIDGILQQIAEEYKLKEKAVINDYINNQIESLKLKPTTNPQFMISDAGKYYRLDNYDYIEEPSVINIDKNGIYTVKQPMDNSRYFLVTTYDMNNKPLSLKVLNANNEIYKSEKFVAKKLNLKQELVNKYKLHGYSGNSSGLFATVCNMVTSPIPSGYYFDKSYSFFKWNIKLGAFEINIREGRQTGSPLMADYDIRENTVIRTDYDGAGINL